MRQPGTSRPVPASKTRAVLSAEPVATSLPSVLGTSLLDRLRIDDAVGAVPVHLFAGIWGTIAVALFAHDGSWLPGLTRWDFLLVQLTGSAAIGTYAFLAATSRHHPRAVWAERHSVYTKVRIE
jgi:ammonia channel protein AmtB